MSARMPDLGPIVRVEWVDSTGQPDWHPTEAIEELADMARCTSAGYLTRDEEAGIVISLGAGAAGHYLDSMFIPRVAIVSIETVTE